MGMLDIVIDTPHFDEAPGLVEKGEKVLVVALVLEPSIERTLKGVLGELCRSSVSGALSSRLSAMRRFSLAFSPPA